jgi:hypothetical protein
MPCPNISPVASAMPRPPDQVRGHCSPAQRRWQPRARCQRALSRLPEGRFSHALGSARARRACTRAVPPTDDRHATGRITDPGCLQRPYHQACRPAHPSACFHHRRPQLRCATRSRKSHRKPIPAPHEIRPGHGPRPARHYIVVASSLTQPGVGRRCRPCASRVQIWAIGLHAGTASKPSVGARLGWRFSSEHARRERLPSEYDDLAFRRVVLHGTVSVLDLVDVEDLPDGHDCVARCDVIEVGLQHVRREVRSFAGVAGEPHAVRDVAGWVEVGQGSLVRQHACAAHDTVDAGRVWAVDQGRRADQVEGRINTVGY